MPRTKKAEVIEEQTALEPVDLVMNLGEIMAHPDNYPDETLAAALDYVRVQDRMLYEMKTIIEGRLIQRMQADGATKMVFKDVAGTPRMVTIKSGPMGAEKDADVTYKSAGFDPLEIGDFVFKPSWTKAKEAVKFGGAKGEAINRIFRRGKDSLTITEL